MKFEFDMFSWYDTYIAWRYKRKSSWRKRFALWPTKLGTHSNRGKTFNYIWLDFYYSKGKHHYSTPHNVKRSEYNDPFFTWGYDFWTWHKVQYESNRTLN